MSTTASPTVRTPLVRSPRARRVASVTLFAALMVVLGGTLVLAVVPGADGGLQQGGAQLLIVIAIGTAGMGIVGAVLAARAPANPLGPLYQVGALAMALAAGVSVYGSRSLNDLPGLPGAAIAGWASQLAFAPAFSATFSVFLLFPDGRPPTRRWRTVGWLLWGGAALAAIGTTFGVRTFDLDPGVIANPFAVQPQALYMAINTLGGVAMFLGGILAVASVMVRFRRSAGDERQQLRWLAWAAVVIIGCAAGLVITATVAPAGSSSTSFDIAFLALITSVLVGLPVATAVAVLRYRLYDLDLVVKKTAIYAIVVITLTSLFLALLGIAAAAGLGTIPAAIVFAIAFNPVGSRARRLAERIVYGDRATPFEVLAEFSERVGETYSIDEVLPRMTQLLASGTGARAVRTWIRQGTVLHCAAVVPEDTDATPDLELPGDGLPSFDDGIHVFPVEHHGELLGAITLALAANDPIDPSKARLAQGVASQAGLALRNVRLVEDLRASRRRIVAAQDERAKALERNIHDGAQQQLVALTVRLRLAEQLAQRDPSSVEETLRDLQSQASSALEDLRDLARGIYPPLLADKGLGAALEAQARKALVPIVVDAAGVGRHPQEIESAVYFCVLEALNNVAKYAEAGAVRVSLSRTDSVLAFEVRDDGRGFRSGATTYGTGLQGMADRLDAVGGTLTVTSEPGNGAIVCGEIPIGPLTHR